MLKKATSGQYVYFTLVSALSGNPVTGASGSISGRKSTDALSGMILLSGNIIELGGGSYRANLYDFDTSGDYLGYLFTASGCCPVQYSLVSLGGLSGGVYPASGVNTVVPPASLSGVVANSGLFVSVPPATLSGVVANSGLTVSVLPATLSGMVVNSGLFVTVPTATLSGVVANSGLNVNADLIRWLTVAPNPLTASGRVDASVATRTGVARSGTATTVQLDAGAPTGASGIYDGQLVYVLAGSGAGEVRTVAFYDSSGNVTVDRAFTVAPFANSVFSILPASRPQSGATFAASGAFANVPPATLSGVVANSGLFVSVPAATLSGVVANSGLFVTVLPANLSGVVVNSGLFVTVLPATISGVVANSGLFASVPPATLSGVVANSGLNVNANVARWLGVAPNALVASGRVDASIGIRTDVARSGTATTVQLDAAAPTGTSGVYDGQLIYVVGGSGQGEARRIAFYDSSGNVTVDRPFAVAPFANSVFAIVPDTNPQSGVNALVPPASLSGVNANSGLFVSVLKATISGVVANSGLFASVPPATLSGTFATVPIDTISGAVANSGLFVTVPPATLSGVVANSGLFVTATATVDPASISGAFVTVPKATISGVVANSGLFVTATAVLASGALSGQQVDVLTNLDKAGYSLLSGSLSGQQVTARTVSDKAGYTVNSGTVFLASGLPVIDASGGVSVASGAVQVASGAFAAVPPATLSGVVANSGLFVTVPKATLSGVVANSGLSVSAAVDSATLSGLFVTTLSANLSGLVVNSGLFVTVPIATISGNIGNSGLFVSVPPATLSGVIANSGLFATVPAASLSGVVANSGLFVTATATVSPASISGAFVTVPPDTVSGLFAVVPKASLSGVIANSGLFATVPPATLSGVVAASGSATLNSGWFADALTYPFAAAADASGQRNLLNAARKLVNRFDLSAFSGRLAVYKEDDATLAYLQDVTTASGAVPITQMKGA